MRRPSGGGDPRDYSGAASFGTITGVSSMIVMFGMILARWYRVLADRTDRTPGFSVLAALAAAVRVAFVAGATAGVG